jgi:hypothetical protein
MNLLSEFDAIMGETSQVTRCTRLSSFLTHHCPSLFMPMSMSAVYYPIIDAVDSIRIDVDQDQPVLGVLTFILYCYCLERTHPLISTG